MARSNLNKYISEEIRSIFMAVEDFKIINHLFYCLYDLLYFLCN